MPQKCMGVILKRKRNASGERPVGGFIIGVLDEDGSFSADHYRVVAAECNGAYNDKTRSDCCSRCYKYARDVVRKLKSTAPTNPKQKIKRLKSVVAKSTAF